MMPVKKRGPKKGFKKAAEQPVAPQAVDQALDAGAHDIVSALASLRGGTLPSSAPQPMPVPTTGGTKHVLQPPVRTSAAQDSSVVPQYQTKTSVGIGFSGHGFNPGLPVTQHSAGAQSSLASHLSTPSYSLGLATSVSVTHPPAPNRHSMHVPAAGPGSTLLTYNTLAAAGRGSGGLMAPMVPGGGQPGKVGQSLLGSGINQPAPALDPILAGTRATAGTATRQSHVTPPAGNPPFLGPKVVQPYLAIQQEAVAAAGAGAGGMMPQVTDRHDHDHRHGVATSLPLAIGSHHHHGQQLQYGYAQHMPSATSGLDMLATSTVEQHARASLAAALSAARAEAAVHSRRADAAARRALESEGRAAAMVRKADLLAEALRETRTQLGSSSSASSSRSRTDPAVGYSTSPPKGLGIGVAADASHAGAGDASIDSLRFDVLPIRQPAAPVSPLALDTHQQSLLDAYFKGAHQQYRLVDEAPLRQALELAQHETQADRRALQLLVQGMAPLPVPARARNGERGQVQSTAPVWRGVPMSVEAGPSSEGHVMEGEDDEQQALGGASACESPRPGQKRSRTDDVLDADRNRTGTKTSARTENTGSSEKVGSRFRSSDATLPSGVAAHALALVQLRHRFHRGAAVRAITFACMGTAAFLHGNTPTAYAMLLQGMRFIGACSATPCTGSRTALVMLSQLYRMACHDYGQEAAMLHAAAAPIHREEQHSQALVAAIIFHRRASLGAVLPDMDKGPSGFIHRGGIHLVLPTYTGWVRHDCETTDGNTDRIFVSSGSSQSQGSSSSSNQSDSISIASMLGEAAAWLRNAVKQRQRSKQAHQLRRSSAMTAETTPARLFDIAAALDSLLAVEGAVRAGGSNPLHLPAMAMVEAARATIEMERVTLLEKLADSRLSHAENEVGASGSREAGLARRSESIEQSQRRAADAAERCVIELQVLGTGAKGAEDRPSNIPLWWNELCVYCASQAQHVLAVVKQKDTTMRTGRPRSNSGSVEDEIDVIGDAADRSMAEEKDSADQAKRDELQEEAASIVRGARWWQWDTQQSDQGNVWQEIRMMDTLGRLCPFQCARCSGPLLRASVVGQSKVPNLARRYCEGDIRAMDPRTCEAGN